MQRLLLPDAERSFPKGSTLHGSACGDWATAVKWWMKWGIFTDRFGSLNECCFLFTCFPPIGNIQTAPKKVLGPSRYSLNIPNSPRWGRAITITFLAVIQITAKLCQLKKVTAQPASDMANLPVKTLGGGGGGAERSLHYMCSYNIGTDLNFRLHRMWGISACALARTQFEGNATCQFNGLCAPVMRLAGKVVCMCLYLCTTQNWTPFFSFFFLLFFSFFSFLKREG